MEPYKLYNKATALKDAARRCMSLAQDENHTLADLTKQSLPNQAGSNSAKLNVSPIQKNTVR
jgi:hypothetical protein